MENECLDEFKIMELMENINSGWLDKNKEKHFDISNIIENNYILQSPEEVIENKIGICLDQVELERHYFNLTNFKFYTYFMVYLNKSKYIMHSFLAFEKNNKYYWFEHSWSKLKGIYEYKTLNELLLDVKEKFIKYMLNGSCDDKSLILHEYTKPDYHISIQDFYNYCDYGRYIDFNKL